MDVSSVGARTRQSSEVYLGASPRGSLALFRSAQALAALRGRDAVVPDDVKALASSTLAHRLMLAPEARLRGRNAAGILAEILEEVPVPVEGEIGVTAVASAG